jgi:hypothetical protein
MIKEHTIKTYTIDDHPEPESVFDWIRNNWHDLGQFECEDFVICFEALAKKLDLRYDYNVSISPDRDEYLKLSGIDYDNLPDLGNPYDFPITGMSYDYDFLVALNEGNINNALDALHKQGDWLYSDEGLRELCEAAEYMFTESGELY